MDNSIYYKEDFTIQDLQDHDQQIVEMLKQIQNLIQQQYNTLLEYQNKLMVSGQLTNQIQQLIMKKLMYYRNFSFSIDALINEYSKINYQLDIEFLQYQESIMKHKLQQTVSNYFT